MMAKFGTSSSA